MKFEYNNIIKTLNPLGIGLIVLAIPSFAGQATTGSYLLRLKFVPGEISKYQSNMSVSIKLPLTGMSGGTGKSSGFNNSYSLKASQAAKVRSASTTGGVLEVTTTSQSSMPGQPEILPASVKPVIMSYDSLGHLTSLKSSGANPTGSPMFSSMLGSGLLINQALMLPSKPVKPGDSWSDKVALPGISGKGSSTVKATFVKMETVGRYQTARLHIIINTPLNLMLDAGLQPTTDKSNSASSMNGAVTITDDINFAVNDGKVVRVVGTSVTTMNNFMGGMNLATSKKKGAPAPPKTKQSGINMTVTMTMDCNLISVGKK